MRIYRVWVVSTHLLHNLGINKEQEEAENLEGRGVRENEIASRDSSNAPDEAAVFVNVPGRSLDDFHNLRACCGPHDQGQFVSRHAQVSLTTSSVMNTTNTSRIIHR